jgi:hypothetical protein
LAEFAGAIELTELRNRYTNASGGLGLGKGPFAAQYSFSEPFGYARHRQETLVALMRLSLVCPPSMGAAPYALVAAHDPEQADDRGLVRGDRIEIAHPETLTAKPSGLHFVLILFFNAT